MTDQPAPLPKKRVIRTRSAAPAAAVIQAAETGQPGPATAPATAAPASPASPVIAAAPKAPAAEADAAAALARAVSGARAEAGKPAEAPASSVNPIPSPGRPSSDRTNGPAPARSRALAALRHPAAQAAALLVALGTGWLGAQAFAGAGPADAQETNRQWAEAAQSLRQGQNDVVRLTGDIKALKVSVEALKESVDRSKADLLTKQSQMMERIERVERLPADTAARLAKLGEQLERVEALGRDPGVKLAALTERFDRMERQMTTLQSAAAKPAPAAEGPAQTGSVEPKAAEPKPPARDVALDGWVLHEVYDGVALIEGRNRRLYEVSQGGNIPGVGPVESIERRGKRWVVVTAKGFIAPER